MYSIEKNIHKLDSTGSTFFLDPRELNEIKSKLKKKEYSIYYPYPDSEKVILYKEKIPEVLLYEIKTKNQLRHQDILGTMYSLSISPQLFGDIIIKDNHYYIYLLPIARNYFECNFLRVKNSSVEVIEREIDLLKEYEREYEIIHIIVSSNRIDTIISNLCHINRKNIGNMIMKKEILINHDFLKDASYKLKEEDVFSVKRIGKFRYIGIEKVTKGEHLFIKLLKYL